jgi:hypothetical protein
MRFRHLLCLKAPDLMWFTVETGLSPGALIPLTFAKHPAPGYDDQCPCEIAGMAPAVFLWHKAKSVIFSMLNMMKLEYAPALETV